MAKKPRSRRRRFAVAAFDIALVVVLGLTVVVAYGLVGNRWYRLVAIEGGSMEPTISRGDLIVVTPAPETIEPGMVLVMSIDGRMVTHRIVEVRADGSLVTKGDANPIVDDWHGAPIYIYGQYQFAVPAIGQFLSIGNTSRASFADQAGAGQRIVVGSWHDEAVPTPTHARGPVSPSPSPSPSPSDPPRSAPRETASPSASDPPPSPSPTATATPVVETATPDPTPSVEATTAPPSPSG